MLHQETALRHATDIASAAAIVSALAGFLPPTAALLGIIWYLMQMWTWAEKRWGWGKYKRNRRATDKA
jgi:hypothetical protein